MDRIDDRSNQPPRGAAGLAAIALLPHASHAEAAYPNRPVRILVPSLSAAAPTSCRVCCKRICNRRSATRSWSRTGPAPPDVSARRLSRKQIPTATRC